MTASIYTRARSIEACAWSDLFAGLGEEERERLGARVEYIGGATVLSVVAVDHPMLNRAFLSSPDPGEALAIAEVYRTRGIQRFFLHRKQPDDTADLAMLAEAGLAPYRRRWVKLAASLEGVHPPSKGRCELPVVRAERSRAMECGALFCRGFDLRQAAAEIFAAALERPAWRVFTATEGAEVVGVGYLYVQGELAYLAGGTTALEHRGRGIQSALMAARLETAKSESCTWITSETGEESVGDPQHSMRNMLRLGLRPIGVTQNLCPAALTWSHGVGTEVPL